MSRRRVITKRVIHADYMYDSKILAKFINHIMFNGKKAVSEKIVYGALNIIKEKSKENELVVFKRALDNIKPLVEVKARRVGGATYQVPVEIRPERAFALSMRWLVEYSRKRSEKGMLLKLASEILDASNEESFVGNSKGKGGAVKKREDTHRMAEANKAFSHYRW
ncbi:MAG: 30S ribosomal protein S7 [Candidatus Azosocius agrarius]|nr:MAG: 30S ribosomal protein S7 [Gammaproteobacteria bacterium]